MRYLRCPACLAPIRDGDPLSCSRCDRTYPIVDGIPALLATPDDADQMLRRVADVGAQMTGYAAFLAAMALLGPAWIPRERRRILERAGLERGQTVLDHCTGPGGNLRPLAERLGPSGQIVAFDLSMTLVRTARTAARRHKLRVDLQQADALALPYEDRYFDAVVHSGAINQFGLAKRRAIDEMVRVTRPGGTVVIVDEGVARPQSWRGRLLTARNPLFASRPPVDLLPRAVDPHVEWIKGGLFWQLQFRTPASRRSREFDGSIHRSS